MKKLLLLTVSICLCWPVFAQHKLLTIDTLYDPEKKVDFSGSRSRRRRWLKDGEHYLEWIRPGGPAAGSRRGRQPVTASRVNARSGKAEALFDPPQLVSAFEALAGFSPREARRAASGADFTLDPQEKTLLIEWAGDLYHYRLEEGSLARLTHSPDEEVEPTFSPDGRMVAFVRNYDLYVVDIGSQHERRLTSGGSRQLFNGELDWVYQEEIYGRGDFKGFWWSPDSNRLAYLQLNESRALDFTVVDHVPFRLDLEVYSYPKAGDPNPEVRLGVISSAGGETTWVDTFGYEGAQFLVVRVGWTPQSDSVVYQVQNREQTWLDLNFADPDTGESRNLLRETSPAWVNQLGDPHWLEDSSFLWFSERSGFKHLYHYERSGKLLGQITEGEWEVRTLHGTDGEEQWVYFSGTRGGATESHVYRVAMAGGLLERLSRAAGSHRASFNLGSTLFIDSWSDILTPTQVRLHDSAGGEVRTIDANPASELAEYRLGEVEFLQVETRDGFVMEAMMIRPPDFDPNRKYPVMSYTYAGPHAQQVRNGWRGTTYLWHQMLAQQGYIIWICDNRTASGKGMKSAWPLYRNFGELELRDLEDGLKWLKSQPYVDGERIGLWGWSFGGYMTSYALTHSKSFKIGIAGAPVTDWRLYDSVYTERYMAMPQNNREGYEKSSPLKAAANLHGKLLIIHGTIDDNVHMQNSVKFIYELQKAGKQFEVMLYPRSRHGVRNPLQVKHLRQMMTNFIVENL